MIPLFFIFEKNTIRPNGTESSQFISTLYNNTDIYFMQYDAWVS